MADIDRAARRLRRMAFVRQVQPHDLRDGATIDFHLRAPPEADTPRPERGPSALRSVYVFDERGEFNRFILRFPPIVAAPDNERRLKEAIRSLNPEGEWRAFTSTMEKTDVSHFKAEAGTFRLDAALDFTQRAIERFNEVFYGDDGGATAWSDVQAAAGDFEQLQSAAESFINGQFDRATFDTGSPNGVHVTWTDESGRERLDAFFEWHYEGELASEQEAFLDRHAALSSEAIPALNDVTVEAGDELFAEVQARWEPHRGDKQATEAFFRRAFEELAEGESDYTLPSRRSENPCARLPAVIEDVIETWGRDPCRINMGECAIFADAVADRVDGVHIVDNVEWAAQGPFDVAFEHAFIECGGRYYDSETPEGVEDWRDLPFFQRNFTAADLDGAFVVLGDDSGWVVEPGVWLPESLPGVDEREIGWEHTIHRTLDELGVGPGRVDEWRHSSGAVVFIEAFRRGGGWNYRAGTEDDLVRFSRRREAESHARELRDNIA